MYFSRNLCAAVTASVLSLASFMPTAVAAEKVDLKFHSAFGEAGINEGVRWWMDEVERRTDNRVTFTRIWGGTLGKFGGQPDGIKARSFDVGQVSSVYNPGLYPRATMFILPFLSDDIAVHNEVAHELMASDEFATEFEAVNQKYMFTGTWITMEMLSYDPLNTIEDLKSIKIRAHGGAAMAMEAAGITTFAIPWGELPAAVERRVVEAATMGAPTDAYDFGFGDLFDYWYKGMPFFFMPTTVVINKESWDEIPADLQAIINEVNADMPAKVLELTMAREGANEKAMVEELGVTIATFADKDKLTEAGLSSWAKWADERKAEGIDGQAILDTYQSLATEQGS